MKLKLVQVPQAVCAISLSLILALYLALLE